MCPMLISTLTLATAGTVSTGGCAPKGADGPTDDRLPVGEVRTGSRNADPRAGHGTGTAPAGRRTP